MEDILESLPLINYKGTLVDKKNLVDAIAGGPKNIEYTKLVNFLTSELRTICNLDEHVNAIQSPDDSSTFLLELSSFLKELQCPFTNLTTGHVTDRLANNYDKTNLIYYLITELMAARMVDVNKPDKKMELTLQESPVATNLKQMMIALKFPKPPATITAKSLFEKIELRLQETCKKAGPELIGNPIFKHTLSEKEWEKLQDVQDSLNDDYTIRREMLLTRLDCTIQSFQWSDRIKGKEDKIDQIYKLKRSQMKVDPQIDLSDLLAARDDLAIIEKTSNASVRKNTQSALNKHIIGPVPDRGGRPSEQAPPPPEMPSWQQRQPGSSGGGRGGGRGRGGDNFNRGGPGGGGRGQDNSNRGGRGQDYNRGGGRGQDNYNRGGNNYQASNNYNQGGSEYNRGSSASYNQGSSQGYSDRGSYNKGYDNRSDNRGQYSDRGNSYGGNTYQVNKTSYAEQYVQDNQQNQQYRGGDRGYDNRGNRGRSNYNRGGYR